MKLIFGCVILWNIVVFLMYGIDKFCAVHDQYRISEKTLLSCAFLGGGFGALFGMTVFRHKTKKTLFRLLVPVFCVLNAAFFSLFTNKLV